MKIPFDIKYRPQIESGEYTVENRDGVHATILEWDIFIHGMAHMMLIRYNDKYEFVHSNGRINRTGQDCNLDLFIVTQEEELTEWEKAIGLALVDYQSLPRDKDGVANIHDINEFTKKKAVELLALAKEECKNQIENDYREIIHGAYEKGKENALKDLEESGRVHCKSYDIGYDDGARDALKDLPRWKKIGRGHNYSLDTEFLINGRYLEMTDYLNDVFEVALSELEKLPKEG